MLCPLASALLATARKAALLGFVQPTVSLLREIVERDPSCASKVYLLEDCSSPVVVPGVADFTQQADEAFDRFSAAGMHRVCSTEAMEDWPGFDLG